MRQICQIGYLLAFTCHEMVRSDFWVSLCRCFVSIRGGIIRVNCRRSTGMEVDAGAMGSHRDSQGWSYGHEG